MVIWVQMTMPYMVCRELSSKCCRPTPKYPLWLKGVFIMLRMRSNNRQFHCLFKRLFTFTTRKCQTSVLLNICERNQPAGEAFPYNDVIMELQLFQIDEPYPKSIVLCIWLETLLCGIPLFHYNASETMRNRRELYPVYMMSVLGHINS